MPDPKLVRHVSIDPAVADLLNGMEQLRQDSQLPRKEREKKARERAKIQARREKRATYDLPPVLRQQINDLAEEQRLPASQLVTLALGRFLQAYQNGEVDINSMKRPSRSPRYDWNLTIPRELITTLPKKKKSPKTNPAADS